MLDKVLKEKYELPAHFIARMETPGCSCRAWKHPQLDRIMVANEDNCPVHGFGIDESRDFVVGDHEYTITSGKRDVLSRHRLPGVDFHVDQWALLRWEKWDEDGRRCQLIWIPGHYYGADRYLPARLSVEIPSPKGTVRELPITVERKERGRLTKTYFAAHGGTLAAATGLPKEVFDELATIFKPGLTYYLSRDDYNIYLPEDDDR